MSVLESVLIEEGNRLNNLISVYEVNLQNLSRGTIFIRKMRNSYFVYKKYKENNKTITIYLGPKGSEEANNGIKEAAEYKRVTENLRNAKANYESLIRAIKAYNRKKTSYIDKSIKIKFKLSKTMAHLIKKAEEADVLQNYGLYMNYAYAIDSQAKKECSYHYLSESQWNILMRRYCLWSNYMIFQKLN